MIIYDPKITGSFQINGSTISSVGEIDNLSGSVAALNNASSSYLLNTTDVLNGNLTVTGTLTAQEFHTEYTSASIVYQSGSTKFGDSADDVHVFTGKLGIGTSTPQVRLDYGNDTGQAFHLYSSGTDYYGINMAQYDSQAYSTNIFSGNGGLIKFRTASGTTTQSTRMTIAANGNVSIGTNTSTLFSTGWGRVLNVAATSGYATVQIAGSNGNGGEVDFGDASIRHGAIASLPGSHLGFYTNSTNTGDGVTLRMTILSSGNVGIGTPSPLVKLDTRGSISAQLDTAYYRLRRTDGTDVGYITDSTTWGDSGTDFSIGASSANLRFYTNNSVAERMRIDSNGNVGISTTGPGAKLHILGSGENGGILFNNAGAQEHRFYSDTYTQFNAIGSSTPVWHWVQYTGVGVTPNYKMTLNNTGLGIGNTSPGYKLDVQGTMLATGTTRLATSSNSTVTIGDARNSQPASSDTKLILSGKNLEAGGTYYGDYGQILFNATSNYTGSAKKWLLTNGFDTYKFSIIMGGASQVTPTIGTAGAVSNGTPVLTIDDNGDVGIGSTNPSSTLDIQTNGSAGIARISADGNGAVYSANGDVQLYTNDAAYSTSIYSANKAGLLFRVQNDGNVGIGTTSPVRILHIENTTSIIHVQSTGLNENASIWFNSNVGGTQANRWEVGTNISAGASLEVYDRLNNQSRMVIKNDGNVGIGTSLPSYKLTVNGNMVALDANASIPTYSYFGLFTENGSLPGYPSNSFPTLKTDDTDMYFSTSGEYNAFLGWNASGYGYFGVKGPGANTIIRGGDGDNEFTGEVKRIGIGGGSYYIALSGNLSGYTANAFNAIKTNQSDLHFDVGGVYTGYINANGGFTDVSDASLKNNVEYITDALTIVSNLKGRKYNWIDENRGTDKQVGFIAQEVEEVLPEVVTEGAPGTKGVAYGKLTAVLVEAMKEQQAIIEDLKARIETLENS